MLMVFKKIMLMNFLLENPLSRFPATPLGKIPKHGVNRTTFWKGGVFGFPIRGMRECPFYSMVAGSE